MIKINKPIALKSLRHNIHTNQAFTEKLLANYDFMLSGIKSEEMIHLLINEPEDNQDSGMTTLVENVNVVNQNDIQLNFINQLINRIIHINEKKLTFQDKVYITCILNKLGINDITSFIKNIKKSISEINTTSSKLRLYENLSSQNAYHSKKIEYNVNNNNIDNTDNQMDNIFNQSANVLYLKIMKRIREEENTRTIYEFNHIINQGDKVSLSHNDILSAEAIYSLKTVRLINEQEQITKKESGIMVYSSNPYEQYSMNMVNKLTTRESILNDMTSIAVYQLVKMAAVNINEMFNDRHMVWIDTGYEICNSIRESIERYRINNEENRYSTQISVFGEEIKQLISENEINILKMIVMNNKAERRRYAVSEIKHKKDNRYNDEDISEAEFEKEQLINRLAEVIKIGQAENIINSNYTNYESIDDYIGIISYVKKKVEELYSKKEILIEKDVIMTDNSEVVMKRINNIINKCSNIINGNKKEDKNILFLNRILENIDGDEYKESIANLRMLTLNNHKEFVKIADETVKEYNTVNKDNNISVSDILEMDNISKEVLYKINTSFSNVINRYDTEQILSLMIKDEEIENPNVNIFRANIQKIGTEEKKEIIMNLSYLSEFNNNIVDEFVEDFSKEYKNTTESKDEIIAYVHKDENIEYISAIMKNILENKKTQLIEIINQQNNIREADKNIKYDVSNFNVMETIKISGSDKERINNIFTDIIRSNYTVKTDENLIEIKELDNESTVLFKRAVQKLSTEEKNNVLMNLSYLSEFNDNIVDEFIEDFSKEYKNTSEYKDESIDYIHRDKNIERISVLMNNILDNKKNQIIKAINQQNNIREQDKNITYDISDINVIDVNKISKADKERINNIFTDIVRSNYTVKTDENLIEIKKSDNESTVLFKRAVQKLSTEEKNNVIMNLSYLSEISEDKVEEISQNFASNYNENTRYRNVDVTEIHSNKDIKNLSNLVNNTLLNSKIQLIREIQQNKLTKKRSSLELNTRNINVRKDVNAVRIDSHKISEIFDKLVYKNIDEKTTKYLTNIKETDNADTRLFKIAVHKLNNEQQKKIVMNLSYLSEYNTEIVNEAAEEFAATYKKQPEFAEKEIRWVQSDKEIEIISKLINNTIMNTQNNIFNQKPELFLNKYSDNANTVTDIINEINNYKNELQIKNSNIVTLDNTVQSIMSENYIDSVDIINYLVDKDEETYQNVADAFVNEIMKDNQKADSNIAEILKTIIFKTELNVAIEKNVSNIINRVIESKTDRRLNDIHNLHKWLTEINYFESADEKFEIRNGDVSQNVYRESVSMEMILNRSEKEEKDSDEDREDKVIHQSNYEEYNINKINRNAEESVININEGSINTTSINNNMPAIQNIVKENVQKEIRNITDQVYNKIEKKLQSERKRRGM